MALPAKALEEITESEWDAQLFRGDKSLAAMCGWKFRYHVLRSRGSQAGFPDRVLVRDRVIYVETKREKGKPTPEQVEWMNALAAAGEECYIWRPSDLEEAGRVLSKRWTLGHVGVDDPSASVRGIFLFPTDTDGPTWTPNSLWIPDYGRYDGHDRI